MMIKSGASAALAAMASGLGACTHSDPPFVSLTPPGMEMLRDAYHLSPAVRAGEFLILSGVIGADGPAAPQSAKAEFELAWKRIEQTLAHSGASAADIVEIVSFHTDMSAIGVFAAVKDRYVKVPYPAWTAIGVNALAVPRARAEIKVTARPREGR